MWRGSGGAGTFLSPSVSAVVVMVSSTQAVVVVVAIAVVVVALLPETATGMPQLKSERRKLSPYALRKTYDNFALKGFLPHRVPCCWYGYDAEGYSRNGRDVSKLIPKIEEIPTM
ncbi:uncharacterized protein LOC127003748 isoform X5 [Eriocheir sinensis]|uniref:uncharacterized protein LOC127003748 isoform X5 n=1 Tax=Eriocheir sinensis TaxID=95602 RepID=UPI0021CA4F04|nr:uncharacterized protein LOC127003748 isoform X5 [Eriocheir sinensis]XP_050726702.1 uncharacterized protein LOC127003748 isoform X5 [Eriocheir sinensis]